MHAWIRRFAAVAACALCAGAAAAEDSPRLEDEVARLLGQGRTAAAVDAARSALDRSPGDPSVRRAYGWALQEAGRSKDALPHLKAAVDAFPGDAHALNNLGCALHATGDGEAALAAFRKAAAMDPSLAAPRNNIGVLQERAGDREGAESSFRAAIALDRRHAPAHNNLGALLYESGRGAEAMRHFVESSKADPNYLSPRINLGALALDRGDDAEAERLLREAAAHPGARVEAHFNLALWGLRKGDLELARTSLEKALSLRPEDPDILNNLGVCHLLKKPGEFRKAEGYFTRATAARATFAQAWDNLGLSLQFLAVQSGDDPRLLERAEQAFRKELELRPDAPFGHYNLGTVLIARGRLGEAEEHFRRAIQLAPTHAEALTNLGYCLSLGTQERKADPAEELRCYRLAVLANPDFPEAHRSLAIFYDTTEGYRDYDRAIEAWMTYARLTTTDEEAQKEAGRAILKIREKQKAAKAAPK